MCTLVFRDDTQVRYTSEVQRYTCPVFRNVGEREEPTNRRNASFEKGVKKRMEKCGGSILDRVTLLLVWLRCLFRICHRRSRILEFAIYSVDMP